MIHSRHVQQPIDSGYVKPPFHPPIAVIMRPRLTARDEAGRDAQVPPGPISFDPREVGLLCNLDGIAAEQPPQRRFSLVFWLGQ
jgi:hypothetical protein